MIRRRCRLVSSVMLELVRWLDFYLEAETFGRFSLSLSLVFFFLS